jgi:type IV pilus assembly protein PilY1
MQKLRNIDAANRPLKIHPLRRTVVYLLCGLIATQSFGQTVSNLPLSAGGNVPGNVVLTPSVEFPTAMSVANQGAFVAGKEYLGYFDPRKCYRYQLRTVAANDLSNTSPDVSYFYPVSMANGTYRCNAAGFTDTWSGSFMNWLSMQAIDPFRWALTGGYRRVDTASVTILERAWSPYSAAGMQGSDTNFPIIPTSSGSPLAARPSPSSADIADYTPMSFSALKVSVRQRGNEILISNGSGGSPPTLTSSSPAPAVPNTGTHQSTTAFATSTVYRYYARVKVCDIGLGVANLEENCVQYSGGYKPEGLLQKYAKRMRFSAVSYLNDPTDNNRDAGVLRAKQKFIGSENIIPGDEPTDNTFKEWDPDTGIIYTNPNPADATSTATHWGVSVPNSGVINYINKFGQEYRSYKRRDPVSELYYAALRYLKNQGNVAQWMPGLAEATKAQLIDGFPVIQTWDDPVQYSCQKNFILGIGDTNSSWDRNLPGATSDSGGPAKPAAVASDTTVSASVMTNKVGVLQGLGASLSTSGGSASLLMSGLAYHAATQDIRPDLANLPAQPRGQNVQTYWLDVLEYAAYAPNNLYYLAAKFGGLKIPEDTAFDPIAATAGSILEPWWYTTTDLVGAQKRPDNFYTVADPQSMVSGLQRAFARIAATGAGSASSLAANSTRLETDTMAFQAKYSAGTWSGNLSAYSVDEISGELSTTTEWQAADLLNARPWAGRNIRVNAGGTLKDFDYTELTASQQTALGSADIVNYLRGDRSKEEALGGTLRTRTYVLGDIVNSTPVFVGKPNARLYSGATFTGAASFAGFASGAASTRTPIVYVGANDGMLHGFNADTGAEVFAFVPRTSIANNLDDFADPNYAHRYFVDGEMTVSDIYDTAAGSWKSILVGTLGRGGPGVFALDVTNPSAPTLLWELNDGDISQLGKNIGRPVIAQVADGDWRVLIGNGPSSSGGRARMISIKLGGASSGTVTVVTPSELSTVNGLSAVLARDSNADGFADTAYAGDLRGNLWKITSLSAGAGAGATRIFTATDAASKRQPITAAPLAARDTTTGQIWVFFGTGQYLGESDLGNDDVQTWYGLKDAGAVIPGRASLIERSITAELTVSTVPVRVIESGTRSELDSLDGWYLDLVSPVAGEQGERMVVPNRLQGAALIGTSRIPLDGDACSPGGSGFVMAIDPFSGSRLASTFFDVNGDGLFNDNDMACTAGVCLPVSGVGFASSPNNPIFIENVMQVSLDDGTTRSMRTQGSSAQATRLSWRELFQ